MACKYIEKSILMNNHCVRIFCFIFALSVFPPGVTSAAAGKDKTDPALEALQALQKTTPDEKSPAQEPASPDVTMPQEPAATSVSPVTTETTGPAESPPVVHETFTSKDIVLVLDNSGSMKKNDPHFLASQAVTEFINNLDTATHISVIIFDQSVRIAVPMTEVNDTTRDEILHSLEQINYKGLYTDSPAAIERAIYELKNSGRSEARKSIIFMTDGIVDTGNAARDQEKVKWLKTELAGAAEDAGIAIIGIAFTEEADFQLIQSLAQKTHGEYYRALKPEDLKNVYDNVHALINKVEQPPVVAAPPVVIQKPAEPVPPPAPVIIEVPAQPQQASKQEQLNSMLIIVVLAVMIIVVIFLILMVMRSSRRKASEEVVAQDAFLNDIHGYTTQPSYKLGSIPTMLGRAAGADTEQMNYIVIPQTTIGRRHALVEYKDYAYWIVDQGSINGTFVNDHMITGETRLKHGDRVRLHKYEFEFAMPEMEEAGMTVVSHTVIGSGLAKAHEKTVAHTSTRAPVEDTNIPEPDFDLGDMVTAARQESSDEDTVLKGANSGAAGKGGDADDETIVMDIDGSTESPHTDATLRPDNENDEDLTADHFPDKDKPQ